MGKSAFSIQSGITSNSPKSASIPDHQLSNEHSLVVIPDTPSTSTASLGGQIESLASQERIPDSQERIPDSQVSHS
jgi:hypothetical protein